MKDTIKMLPRTAEAIGVVLNQDFSTIELPERMARIVLLLKRLPDEIFPHGKWATIQEIEHQLDECADFKQGKEAADKEGVCLCGIPEKDHKHETHNFSGMPKEEKDEH